MRQLIELNTGERVKFKGLTDEMILSLGNLFNTREMMGIETVYFTVDGEYWLNAYPYSGNEKIWKGKKYARFGYQQKEVTTPTGEKKWIRQSFPLDEYEIVAEFEVEDIINKYVNLMKKNKNK